MKKIVICGVSLCTLVAAVALSTPRAGAAAATAKSAKEIMGALFKGPKAAMGTLKTATKAATPDWPKIKKTAETFATHAEDLPKNEPPKGDKASFEKLSKAFASNAKTLKESADKEDLTAVQDSMRKIGSSCMTCHRAHKPN